MEDAITTFPLSWKTFAEAVKPFVQLCAAQYLANPDNSQWINIKLVQFLIIKLLAVQLPRRNVTLTDISDEVIRHIAAVLIVDFSVDLRLKDINSLRTFPVQLLFMTSPPTLVTGVNEALRSRFRSTRWSVWSSCTCCHGIEPFVPAVCEFGGRLPPRRCHGSASRH